MIRIPVEKCRKQKEIIVNWALVGTKELFDTEIYINKLHLSVWPHVFSTNCLMTKKLPDQNMRTEYWKFFHFYFSIFTFETVTKKIILQTSITNYKISA